MPDPEPISASSPPATWLERLPASVVVILDGCVHYANQAALKLLGATSSDQLLGRIVSDFVHPLDQHRVLARLQWTEGSEGSSPPTEFRAYTCTGRQVVLAMTSNHVPIDGRGGVLAAFLDMTERVAMEVRLQETDQNFQRIMNTMQDVFYRTDAQGTHATSALPSKTCSVTVPKRSWGGLLPISIPTSASARPWWPPFGAMALCTTFLGA